MASNGDAPLRVAVVGCGVAGLGAAHALAKAPGARVTMYEAGNKLGGHANTVEVRQIYAQPRCGGDVESAAPGPRGVIRPGRR